MNTLILHHLKAEEIPEKWAKELPKGQRFTITITVEKPQQHETELLENAPDLFGIWKDLTETQNIASYVRELRKGRFYAD